ncbi:MAG: SpoIIE family protein phosphatase [Phycisphaerae bacterium]|nr:SpoIIE family protein phosphatase [Phycisphaerae bacterium]
MAEEARQIQDLRRLLDVTRQMAATIDLTQLLETIVDATLKVLDCERATIFLYDKKSDELYSRVATGVESIRFPANRGIAGAAAAQRAVINVPDAYADSRFNQDIDKETGFHTRNLLTFPLENLDGELMGVLQALNKADGPFTPEDEDLARVLSAQAGVALHRYALLEEYAEKQRMARDLELARKIQQALFPKANPSVAGYEIAGWNRSADETGGDCYDFVALDDGRNAILLADATGHGIGAALVIAQCRSLTRAMLSLTAELTVVATRINHVLAHDLTDDRFVTAFIGVLDPARHCLDYIAAGQGPLLCMSPAGVETRAAGGLPFAVIDDFDCPPEKFEFAPGATVVLLTDGFYETKNQAGELFGEERVIEFFQHHADLPLEELIDGLHNEIRRFSHDAPQEDDLTAVLVRRQA